MSHKHWLVPTTGLFQNWKVDSRLSLFTQEYGNIKQGLSELNCSDDIIFV